MVDQPRGIVTFLFSDIEGSTRLLHQFGSERFAAALADHRRLLRNVFEEHGGYEVDAEGDAFFVAFASAASALGAAGGVQVALDAHAWPDGAQLRVRIGVHTGEPWVDPPRYVGLDVHVAARVMAAAHGGQVLVSEPTRSLAVEQEPGEIALIDLGEHGLKDLMAPLRLHQLVVPRLASEFPPPRTRAVSTTTLPSDATRFLDREQQRAEVRAELTRSDVRLLTLTGFGGTGKTRLALQVARESWDDYRDGARFVALGATESGRLLGPTIAQALGLVQQTGGTTVELLRAYLAEREMLLVLDNLEHLLDGVPLIAELLAECQALTILATSREPLHLSGERAYAVPSLDEDAAVELFVERARAAAGEFTATGDVTEICRRLDAVPLAIELAAARVSVLSPHALLARLDRSLPLLTGGPRDAPERQRTLRATIDWSYALLSPAEQRLLSCLGVFADGCTFEAAETVCEADLDTLHSLVDKSLVRHQAARYLLPSTIREYAFEQLERAGLTDQLRDSHAAHFLVLAERAAPELRSTDDGSWLDQLEAERDNLRGALHRIVERGDATSAHRLVCALMLFWHDRGPVAEACEAIAEALALPLDSSLRARTLGHGSIIACYGADYALARTWADEGIVLAEADDHVARMTALLTLGLVAYSEHRHEDGAALFEQALAEARAARDEWAIGVTIVTLLSHDAVADLSRAEVLADEAAGLNVNDSTRAMIANCRGMLAERRGDDEEAVALVRESVALAREARFERVPMLLLNLGWLTLRRGDLVEARTHLASAATQAAETGARGFAAAGVAYLAVLAAAEGDTALAGTLRGAAESYRESVTEIPLTEFSDGTFDDYLADARAAAGPAWDEALRRGRTLSITEALTEALEPRLLSASHEGPAEPSPGPAR